MHTSRQNRILPPPISIDAGNSLQDLRLQFSPLARRALILGDIDRADCRIDSYRIVD
jgi:hypothetical protein